MSSLIIVFTGKDAKAIQIEGGSGYWIAQEHRILEADYLLCVRNHRETWAIKDDGVDHGEAFFIAKGLGWSEVAEHRGRKLITFKEYACLPKNDPALKDAWRNLTSGQRYPVAYKDLQDVVAKLQLDLTALNWKQFENTEVVDTDNESIETTDISLATVILNAKKMIADAANVDLSNISVHIQY